MNDEQLVSIRNVSKRYKETVALDNISFDLARGEIVGLLGPNGAGKTTLLEILYGTQKPTEGSVTVLGINPYRSNAHIRKRIGVSLQNSALPPLLTASELYKLFCHFNGNNDWSEMLERLNLSDKKNTRIMNLSSGQRQRLAFGLAFLHPREMIFLDEPTANLDVESKKIIYDLISERGLREGRSILMTTHQISDITKIFDRVIFIKGGKKGIDSGLANLIRKYSNTRIVSFSFLVEHANLVSERFQNCYFERIDNKHLKGSIKVVDYNHDIFSIISELSKLSIPIFAIQSDDIVLEDLYKSALNGELL